MAGETTPDTGAVADGDQPQQAQPSASAADVPDGASRADVAGSTRQSAHEGESLNARLIQAEKDIRRLKKLFSNHSHEVAEEHHDAQPTTSEATPTEATSDAATPAIGEKPPKLTASHLEEKQQARQQYFRRIHRQKRRTHD